MRRTAIIAASLALVGCGAPDSGDAPEDAATEDAATEAPDFEPNPGGYIQDIGLIEGEMNTELSERLIGFHRESGHEIHIAVILTTDGEDVTERAAAMIGDRGISENGALILIALADETIGIAPAPGAAEALPPDFVDTVEAEMGRRFDAREIREGLNGALDALFARLDG
ncbi:TPM domain-containing protein [Parasphingopyxis sp.]|uniref:TPM domain-containing protein n=1 Tax=Parasphingopyxis sp. TaxID=1920299 RepID=UPI00260E274E|nr:TPM domain-containing protein [Parasphingopyxis sp.]